MAVSHFRQKVKTGRAVEILKEWKRLKKLRSSGSKGLDRRPQPLHLPAASATAATPAAATMIGVLLGLAEGLDFADGLLGDGVHGCFSFQAEGEDRQSGRKWNLTHLKKLRSSGSESRFNQPYPLSPTCLPAASATAAAATAPTVVSVLLGFAEGLDFADGLLGGVRHDVFLWPVCFRELKSQSRRVILSLVIRWQRKSTFAL